MARAIHVKKARKANKAAGIKKGQEYWWASFRSGSRSYKRYWTSPPRPSQLTQSEFLSNAYGIAEDIDDATVESVREAGGFEDWVSEIVERIRELGEEQQSKKDNMPDSLQDSSTGELLEERAEAMDSWAQAIEGCSCDDDDNDESLQSAIEEVQSQESGV